MNKTYQELCDEVIVLREQLEETLSQLERTRAHNTKLREDLEECREISHKSLNAALLMRHEARQQDPGTKSLPSIIERQRKFSARTFGPGMRTEMVIDHIRKELREIEAAPFDVTEWVDVILLAMDGAWRSAYAGGSYSSIAVTEAIVAKLTENESRSWPAWQGMDPTKAIEHDRSAEGGDQ
ncbi:dATP/dGTP pyrophosphohydrolase domain-containing protein [Modicisalibacter sp. MOD 31.J]|uniref:dATP/dGTP pyrophosphohydrolase domain-containing protein n=1 Tax=Modicisalibacter sp. MOD 31.J TaxID=2831897 RepID=UPI001CCAAAC2|nr:dATP/dGTP pyrophosphohydrolase domain-containing protein [Modicisalibacter sp. MOD 31.J]MBZ9576761.1 DUF550 domain-containing protein [Modicisalibacter sp. MOD 31.J]